MEEHRISVTRTARYYTLGEFGGNVAEVWFVLHGYGQLAAPFVNEFRTLDDGSRLIVAPEGLSRYYVDRKGDRRVGASWMTREDRLAEIADYVRYLDAVHTEVLRHPGRASAAVHVLGFSQGTATACRWLALGRARADRLILWGGEVPPDLDLAAARERLAPLHLTLVVGRGDTYITKKIIAREESNLRDHGIPYHLVWFDGGHELETSVLQDIAAS